MSLYQTGVRQIIDDHLIEKAKEVRDYGDYWSASSAGYCMRKVIFERLGVPHSTEDDPRKQRVFSAGHIFHDWIQKLTRDAGISIAQEVELQDEDLMIRGHFDDLVLVMVQKGMVLDSGDPSAPLKMIPPIKQLILYDYKTVNSRSFLWAKKNGNAMSYFHRMQLATYMYMLRKEMPRIDALGNEATRGQYVNEARILKIEKDTLMMGEQQLLWSDELSREVNDYWTTLNAYWNNKKIPPCTCADREGGFMAKPQYNPFYYEGEPCSLQYYQEWRKEQVNVG